MIYDGHCAMCTGLAIKLGKADTSGVFEIVPSQLTGVHDRFPWIAPEAYAESLQVVRNSDNRTWQGAAAVEQIVSELRAGWFLSWLFAIPFGRPIADRLYRWIADHRHELGCGDHCRVHATPSDTGEKNS